MTKPFSVVEDIMYVLEESAEDVISVYLDTDGVIIYRFADSSRKDKVCCEYAWDRDA